MPYYQAAGEKLLEAKSQMKHGEFIPWVARNFSIKKQQASLYMALAKHTEFEKSGATDFSSLSDFERETGRRPPDYNTFASRKPSPLQSGAAACLSVKPVPLRNGFSTRLPPAESPPVAPCCPRSRSGLRAPRVRPISLGVLQLSDKIEDTIPDMSTRATSTLAGTWVPLKVNTDQNPTLESRIASARYSTGVQRQRDIRAIAGMLVSSIVVIPHGDDTK